MPFFPDLLYDISAHSQMWFYHYSTLGVLTTGSNKIPLNEFFRVLSNLQHLLSDFTIRFYKVDTRFDFIGHYHTSGALGPNCYKFREIYAAARTLVHFPVNIL
jgi:hypothetical protein